MTPFLDLSDPDFSVTSEAVRQAREASWYARTSFGIAVLRYDEAARLIRHPKMRQGSAAWPAHNGITSGPFARWWASWVLNQEGEDHQRLRRLLMPAFSKRVVDAMVPRFRALAGELVDSFTHSDRCEFMSEFAEPYAARVIATLLGLPDDEWRAIAAGSAAVGLAMGVTIRDHLVTIEAGLASLHRYADAVIADRRRDPRDDFVTRIACPPDTEDALSDDELRDSLALLMFGGFDTTRGQLGLAMNAFIDHPGQWQLLGDRPELAPAAVEEVMRLHPTTTWVTRAALDDFSFDGLDIKRGTTIHLLTQSAGTDPRAFPQPGLDITAPGRPPHFGFGGGVHYCLGHLVARADLSEALAVLACRLRKPHSCGEAAWLPCSGNTGPVRLPVAFTPG
jgi:cytochrome P450